MTVPQWSGMTLLFHTSVRSSNTPLKSRDMSTSLLCRKSVTVQHTQLSDYNTIAVLISQCLFPFAKLTIQTINSLYTNTVAIFFIFSKMMVNHMKSSLNCSPVTRPRRSWSGSSCVWFRGVSETSPAAGGQQCPCLASPGLA